MSAKVQKLLKKGLIKICTHKPQKLISAVFLREKKDDAHRTKLSLKYLNEFVQFKNIKTKSILDAFKITKINSQINSVDIKGGIFTVLIHMNHQQYLKTKQMGKL